MDLMTALDKAQALSVALLILTSLYALMQLAELSQVLINRKRRKEENETGLRDVQPPDDPRP